MKSHNVSKDPVSIHPTTGTAGAGHRSDGGLTNPVGPASTYRSREKGREEWGLPPREALRSLARTYVEQQAVHWPGLLGTAALPEVSESTIDAMAAAFERRFRSQSIELFDPAGVPARWRSLGGAYARFSDEGSNPRSLNQQLVNILARARRDDVFIPWEYVCGDAAIKSVIRKVADMERDLEALRAELVAERRRNQSPPVTRVKEKDVLAELNRLREVLLADVGGAAPVLKALVGDVVIEARAVEGQKKTQMFARFTIDEVPAIAALRRGKGPGADDPTTDLWEFLHTDRWIMPNIRPPGNHERIASSTCP